MNLITKILPIDNIVLDMDVSSKKRLFEESASILEARLGVGAEGIFECLFAREKLGSTGLGQSTAIPHGRMKGVKETMGIFVRVKEPIDFDAPDGKPVRLFFILLVPEDATSQHLEVLSELANIFSSKESREALLNAQSREEALEVFSKD